MNENQMKVFFDVETTIPLSGGGNPIAIAGVKMHGNEYEDHFYNLINPNKKIDEMTVEYSIIKI